MIYIGAGLSYLNRDITDFDEDDTKDETYLFVGIQLPLPRLHILPFVEARWTNVEEKSLFRLAIGVNIPIGGHR